MNWWWGECPYSTKTREVLGNPSPPPSTFPSTLEKSLGRRGWISQYLPRFGGARIHYTFHFFTIQCKSEKCSAMRLSALLSTAQWVPGKNVGATMEMFGPSQRLTSQCTLDLYCNALLYWNALHFLHFYCIELDSLHPALFCTEQFFGPTIKMFGPSQHLTSQPTLDLVTYCYALGCNVLQCALGCFVLECILHSTFFTTILNLISSSIGS